ncbi:CPCC family cysteine-rich protein [Massilia phyllosphaerae]|uniref:CPCC family cysteine-rich protein n=1 Tax=Massilia phyllosphaerae TaxID=3106034 RepID=UPI002B1CBD9A|nr:CPCC family cysteine-rich protein [Massilia sp. SGZ-792]
MPLLRREQMSLQDQSLFRCPCCEQITHAGAGCYEICDLCGWVDDPVQSSDPEYLGGANCNSLREARDALRRQALPRRPRD